MGPTWRQSHIATTIPNAPELTLSSSHSSLAVICRFTQMSAGGPRERPRLFVPPVRGAAAPSPSPQRLSAVRGDGCRSALPRPPPGRAAGGGGGCGASRPHHRGGRPPSLRPLPRLLSGGGAHLARSCHRRRVAPPARRDGAGPRAAAGLALAQVRGRRGAP